MSKPKPRFHVQDWTSRVLTDFGTYADFESAWGAIYEWHDKEHADHDPDECGCFDDLFVEGIER